MRGNLQNRRRKMKAKNCGNCGTPNPAENRYCVKCGTAFPNVELDQVPADAGSPKTGSGSTAVKICAAICVCAVVAAVIVVLLRVWPRQQHTWEAATCVTPKTCTECGETEGEALGHAFTEASCTDPSACVNCGVIIEPARGHQWQETDDGGMVCSVCQERKAGDAESAKKIIFEAEEKAEAGRYREAIQILDNAWKKTGNEVYYNLAGDYRMEFGISNSSYMAAGKYNSIIVRDDGTVVVAGDDEFGELDAKHWTDIVAVSAGDRHIVGLRADGTVVSAGSDDVGQRRISGWSNVIAIAAGDVHTIALKKDGTLLAAGQLYAPRCDVKTLQSLAGNKRIVAIAAGYVHTIALLEDGTVIASGENGKQQCDVAAWTDIAAIYAGTDFSMGLKTDGTVVMAGRQPWNTSGWMNIVNMAAGDFFVVGITDSGELLAFGMEDGIDSGLGKAISEWGRPAQIAGGNDHFLVMNEDGLVRGVGHNEERQAAVWDVSVGLYPRKKPQ